MKKLFSKWQATSHLKKTLILLVAIFLMAFLVYIARGCPPLNAKMALRQEEMWDMVGPSQIIAQFQQETLLYEEVIVGCTEHIYTLLAFSPEEHISDFVWYERTEKAALYSLPGSFPQTNTTGTLIPLNLIMFDTEPRAKRAEIELEITYQHNDTYTKTFSAEALREYDGFFLFSIYAQDTGISSVNFAGLNELMRRCNGYDTNNLPVTVRLYDAQNTLISTQTVMAGPTS